MTSDNALQLLLDTERRCAERVAAAESDAAAARDTAAREEELRDRGAEEVLAAEVASVEIQVAQELARAVAEREEAAAAERAGWDAVADDRVRELARDWVRAILEERP